MIRQLILIFLCSASLGCYAQQPASKVEPTSVLSSSICEVLASPEKVLGTQVRLNALYKTDNAHYEYLVDRSCSGVLSVGNVGLALSKSVKGFYEDGQKKCAEMKAALICNLEADVDVTVRVITLQNGKAGVDLIDMHKFSFGSP